MNSVLRPAMSSSTRATAAGSVLSRTCSVRPAGLAAPHQAHDLRPQRAAAHAQQHDVGEPGRRDLARRRLPAPRACSRISAGERSQPEAALDRSLVRRGRSRTGVASPSHSRRQRARLRLRRSISASVAACSASGSDSRWRPDADSSSAARRPAIASSSAVIDAENDCDAVGEQPVADARQVEARAPRTRRPPAWRPPRSSPRRAAGSP